MLNTSFESILFAVHKSYNIQPIFNPPETGFSGLSTSKNHNLSIITPIRVKFVVVFNLASLI